MSGVSEREVTTLQRSPTTTTAMLTAQLYCSRREERYVHDAQLLPSTWHAARNTERSASQPQPSSVCLKVFTHPKAAMVPRQFCCADLSTQQQPQGCTP